MFSVFLLLVATQCVFTGSSSVPFSPIPPLPPPVSETSRSSHGLGGFYDLGGGLVNAIRPGHLPRDTVANVAALVIEHVSPEWDIPSPDTDTEGVVKQFLGWLAPAIAAVVLGLVLSFIVPITGCCVVCCRKCGRCGAKSRVYRKKHQNIKCFVFTCFFLISTVMIFIGAILGAVSVKHMSDSLKQIESTADNILSDIGTFLDGGANQVNFIAIKQFSVLEARVLEDLELIGEWFQDNIGGDLHSESLDVVDHAQSFLTTLKGINDSITSGNALIEDMKNVTLLLESRISILSVSISNLSYLCNGTVAAPQSAACAFLSSTDFAITVDYTNIGNVDFNDQVNLTAIEEQIMVARDIFQDIGHYIDTEAEEYQLTDKVEDVFLDAYWTIRYDFLNAINETVTDNTGDGGTIDGARSEVHKALKYLDTYEPFWTGVSLTLVCLFFLVVTFFLVGVFCGSFGYSRVVQPHSRSSVSHCGGNCILVGIVIAFVTSPVLVVVTSTCYGLATGVQKVCDDIAPPDYRLLSEVADDPAVWGGVTLVGVLTRESLYSTVNLSITQMLRGCAENEAIWKVLEADKIYTSVDFEDAFNCTTFGVGNGDFLPFDGFNSGDIFPSLSQVSDSYDRINFEEYDNITNNTAILSFDLTELETNLTTLHTVFVNTSDTEGQNLTSKILSDLDSIELLLNDLQESQMNVEWSIREIEMIINSSESELMAFVVLLDSFLEELPHVVGQATDDYIKRLCGFIDDYLNYANYTLSNDLAKCRAIPVVYDAAYTAVCEKTLDGLNGYWLGVGWCMLFSIVAVVLGIILSDYFRRASTRVVKCTDTSSSSASLIPHDDDDDEDVSAIRMNPKHPPRPPTENSLPEEQQPLHTTQMDLEW